MPKARGSECWRRKKRKEKTVTATTSAIGPFIALVGMGKGKGKVGGSQRSRANDVCMHCQGNGHWKRECPQLLSKSGVGKNQKAKEGRDDLNSRRWEDRYCGSRGISQLNVCGSLYTPARRGYSYVLTFIDDYSRYGYVYLMRYKSVAFGRFNECRLEDENQTGRKIKTLWLDRGGEYLSGEFIDFLKENRILCQRTPPGTPKLNGVAKRRN
ncbi:UNVERIFIED_CONTAM: Retrovirus-related Pol polyprotein from transposon TNT 1-94 [Sesamum angustifolium]|uniref:Retrovirus-related Pol polyprotein from transposon TNT 1-94 n=1 Tax=Sesamum angustifolium TaxID=2727405 RepID=A0AAW2JLW2_9LAMI